MKTHNALPRRSLFDEYAQERRAFPIPGYEVELLPYLTRYLPVAPGGEGLVAFARIVDRDAARHIREQVDFFKARNQAIEWKVYDFDVPGDLRALLEAEGFTAHHDEAFMIRAIDDEVRSEGARTNGIRVLRAALDNNVIDDVVAVQEQVWDCRFPWLAPQLGAAMAQRPENTAIYCAYLDERPVGTGWIDFTQGSRFADLHGGAVVEGARGRGIYSLLYERRTEEARRRECRYLAVDAAPMSRPILEHKGFVQVCNTYPMRLVPHERRQ
jgi:GNAT superfamily N-acetyltransferase